MATSSTPAGTKPDLTKLARFISAHAPYDGNFDLRLPRVYAMQMEMLDASAAGRRVGYISASQFSREYGRFFGNAPTKDIHRLREEGHAAAEAPP